MTETDPRLFTLTGPDGETIMRGSMSAVTEPLLDSKARAEATQLLIDAARACGLIESVAARENAVRADEAQQLIDGIAAIERRLDRFVAKREAMVREDAEREAQRIQDVLDSLPDPDFPDGGGDLRPLAPPDKERYAPND
jgi:hypothetical protein